jgi:hypothetical protein
MMQCTVLQNGDLNSLKGRYRRSVWVHGFSVNLSNLAIFCLQGKNVRVGNEVDTCI